MNLYSILMFYAHWDGKMITRFCHTAVILCYEEVFNLEYMNILTIPRVGVFEIILHLGYCARAVQLNFVMKKMLLPLIMITSPCNVYSLPKV